MGKESMVGSLASSGGSGQAGSVDGENWPMGDSLRLIVTSSEKAAKEQLSGSKMDV